MFPYCIQTEAEAKAWAERLVTTVQDYGLDGIDLDVEDSAVAGDVQVHHIGSSNDS